MDYSHLTDEELVAAYLSGDNQAFANLVNRYLKPVYNFIYRFCGNQFEAEDIAEESFIKLWRHIKKFRQGEKFKTWFFTIARNTAIDHMRKKKHIPFSQFENDDGENFIEETIADTEPSAEALFERSENKALVEGLLEELPVYYKEVLYLYYNEELTLEEISQVMKKSLNTIKSQHRRAIGVLRKRLHPK